MNGLQKLQASITALSTEVDADIAALAGVQPSNDAELTSLSTQIDGITAKLAAARAALTPPAPAA